ncbi:MAG: entericidin A/B family lipoprotein [Sedimenticolaceae bacterium]|nr:entericidin A/B family lipoprotein [Sedimenticolaceae bacterium]
MKKVVYMLTLIASLVVFAGCETVKGVGKDVQKAGDAIEKAAD